MKIKIVNEDGKHEVLTLTEPLTIVRSEDADGLNCIRTATGMEHWWDQDGNYDGWSMDAKADSPEDAAKMALKVNSDREIEE